MTVGDPVPTQTYLEVFICAPSLFLPPFPETYSTSSLLFITLVEKGKGLQIFSQVFLNGSKVPDRYFPCEYTRVSSYYVRSLYLSVCTWSTSYTVPSRSNTASVVYTTPH